MSRNNKFLSASLSIANVELFYTPGKSGNFIGFVLQQMMANGDESGGDQYGLTAFAIFNNSTLPDSPIQIKPVPLPSPKTDPPPPLKPKTAVYFANIKLGLSDLQLLYPGNIVDSDITLSPVFYDSAGYVGYVASTPDSRSMVVPTITLNPSPPA
jgi:hypothetical protein